MIEWIIQRLKMCQCARVVILATTLSEQDSPLIRIADKCGIAWFRGKESDVLDRFYKCASEYDLDDIVRATGDNPFVDPEEGDRLVDLYLRHNLDYAIASSDIINGFPLGVGLHVLSFNALERSWKEGLLPHHREHADEYILENPSLFAQACMLAPQTKRGRGLSLTVDTPADFAVAERLYVTAISHGCDAIIPVDWAIRFLRGHRLV